MAVGTVVERYDDTLFAVLDLVRPGAVLTRPDLIRRSGQGRKLVTQRVERLIDRGLIVEGDLAPSSGGRAPRELRFRAEAGHLLVAVLGGYTLSVGLTDLAGRLIKRREEPASISVGDDPEATLGRIAELFDELIAERAATDPPLWGVGLGVPGPVDAATGRMIPVPGLVLWGNYPVRERFTARYDVPVWVDNEANLMALGELRSGRGRDVGDLIFVNLDRGIGMGLISGGRLHRGAHGTAGEFGHTTATDDTGRRCWCGNTGCLRLSAGGEAMVEAGGAAAMDARSVHLGALRAAGKEIDIQALVDGLAAADEVCVELFSRTGTLVGQALAGLVSSFDPALIVIGGSVAAGGDLLLAAIRQAVYRRAFPAATRDLAIVLSPLDGGAGLIGASFRVIDEILSPGRLPRWLDHGSPVGRAVELYMPLGVE